MKFPHLEALTEMRTQSGRLKDSTESLQDTKLRHNTTTKSRYETLIVEYYGRGELDNFPIIEESTMTLILGVRPKMLGD